MTFDNSAATAQLHAKIRQFDERELEAITIARGVAYSDDLAKAAAGGMWFFLGVQVDPTGLRPQRVRWIEVRDESQAWEVVLTEDERRILTMCPVGDPEPTVRINGISIEVQWSKEVGR